MRRIQFWFAGIACIAALACASQVRATDAAPGTAAQDELRVGIAGNYPPLAFKQDGELAGIEVEFARQLGTELGLTIRLVELPFPDLIPALLANRIDVIMSGMSITPEREKLVSFTDSYLRVGQMRLMRRADADRLNSHAAMNKPTTHT